MFWNGHIKKIIKNDILIDTNVYATDNESFYYDGIAYDIDEFSGNVDIGNMPTQDNELLLVGPRDNYYLNEMKDKIIGLSVALGHDGSLGNDKKYKIVGISYIDDDLSNSNLYIDGYVYGTSEMIKNLQFSINQNYSEIKVLFNNKFHNSDIYEAEYHIVPSDKVSSGNAYITEDWNIECNRNNCLNENLSVLVKNLYYEDKVDLKVSRLYNRNNIKNLLNVSDFDLVNGAIYINTNDYNKLFMHGNYQSSIYVDDVKYVDDVARDLENDNCSVLKIKDTKYNVGAIEAIKIVRTIITIILLITLFFISYFVIRIILKSRNIYFGTIRILGATKRDAKELLGIELVTVSNIAYIGFLIVLYLHSSKIINIKFFNTIIKYLNVSDYIILYIIITIMSYLISVRFARKIFKNSAMNTMREGV